MARASLKSVTRLIDAANKKMPVEDQFVQDLCRSIELDDEKGWRIPSKTFKPSSMNCARNSYYQIMGIEPDRGNSTHTMVGICNSGSDIHSRMQDAIMHMADNGMDCEYVDVSKFVHERALENIEVKEQMGAETKLYNKLYNISFMCDGIIRYKGKYYILEMKTETSMKWYSRTGVDPKHYKQAISYSLSLGLENVLFLYIDRDMNNKKAYLFHVSDEMRQSVVDYISDVNGYVSRKIPPPKPETGEKRMCSYCGYQQQCRKDG